MAVAKFWEETVLYAVKKIMSEHLELREDSTKPSYFLSDNAGQCKRARNILARQHPSIVFGFCWAHQINLMVRCLLERSEFKEVLTMASKAAVAVTKSSSKWYKRLRLKAKELYGHNVPVAIHNIGATRWNSTQACFASQLRIRSACEILVTTYKNCQGEKLPRELLAWGQSTFWVDLEEAELLICPFCDASHLMQREGNTMAHVLLTLMNLYNDLCYSYGGSDSPRTSSGTNIAQDIEDRWAAAEQPLFFLSFCLHPEYQSLGTAILCHSTDTNGSYNSGNALTVGRLQMAARFYWQKFVLTEKARACEWTIGDGETTSTTLDKLSTNLKKWLKKEKMVGLDKWDCKTESSPLEYWRLQQDEYPVLSFFAVFLLGAPVQAATAERVFKHFSGFHTKERNQMKQCTTTKLTKLKYHIQMQRERVSEEEGQDQRRSSKIKTANRIVHCTEHRRKDDEESTEEQVEDECSQRESGIANGSIEQSGNVNLSSHEMNDIDEDDDHLPTSIEETLDDWRGNIHQEDIESTDDNESEVGENQVPEDSDMNESHSDGEKSFSQLRQNIDMEGMQEWVKNSQNHLRMTTTTQDGQHKQTRLFEVLNGNLGIIRELTSTTLPP